MAMVTLPPFSVEAAFLHQSVDAAPCHVTPCHVMHLPTQTP